MRQRRERGQSPSLRRRTSRCRCRFYCWCCCCRDWGLCYCYHRYLLILRILSIIGRRGRAERAQVVIAGELSAALAWPFTLRASRGVCGSHGEGVRRLFESGRSGRRSSSIERTGWEFAFRQRRRSSSERERGLHCYCSYKGPRLVLRRLCPIPVTVIKKEFFPYHIQPDCQTGRLPDRR
jgi:hypothetical protein